MLYYIGRKDVDEELRKGKACRERTVGERAQSVLFQWDPFRVGAPKAFFQGLVDVPVGPR